MARADDTPFEERERLQAARDARPFCALRVGSTVCALICAQVGEGAATWRRFALRTSFFPFEREDDGEICLSAQEVLDLGENLIGEDALALLSTLLSLIESSDLGEIRELVLDHCEISLRVDASDQGAASAVFV